jgi:hypothetical protein
MNFAVSGSTRQDKRQREENYTERARGKETDILSHMKVDRNTRKEIKAV